MERAAPPTSSIVRVAMVDVWIVRVRMHERCMAVGMTVRLARRVVRTVLMQMVRIVYVKMCVLERLVDMAMLMVLGRVQPDSSHHGEARDRE